MTIIWHAEPPDPGFLLLLGLAFGLYCVGAFLVGSVSEGRRLRRQQAANQAAHEDAFVDAAVRRWREEGW